MKKVIYFAGLLFCFNLASAQVEILKRLELPLEDNYDEINFEPIGEAGILQIATAVEMMADLLDVRVQHYDSNLVFLSEKSVKIPNKRLDLSDLFYDQGKLHIVLKDDGDFVRYVIFDLETSDTVQVDYRAQKRNYSCLVRHHQGKIYIFEIGKKAINLVVHNIETGKRNKRPLNPRNVKPKHFSITETFFPEQDSEDEDIFFVASIRLSRGVYAKKLLHLHPDGILDETPLTSVDLPEVHDLSMIKTQFDNQYLIFGSYGNRDMSNGLFMGSINRETFTLKAKYSYGEDFDSLLTTMPKLTQRWQKWRKKKANKRGEEFDLQVRTISHPIEQLDDGGFLWVSELYHPVYRQVPNHGPNGAITYTNYFDGFQTTHAVVARIDASGNLLWDRAFSVVPLQTPYRVRRFLTIEFDGEQINFIYQRGRNLHDLAYNYNGERVYSSKEMQILTDLDEKTKHANQMTLSRWYGNRLVAYGYQKIKNTENRKKSRKVYSVNKIVIQTEN